MLAWFWPASLLVGAPETQLSVIGKTTSTWCSCIPDGEVMSSVSAKKSRKPIWFCPFKKTGWLFGYAAWFEG